jgi:hypothetical protein
MPAPTPESLLAKKIREAGVSEGYSHDLARGNRRPSRPLAIKIYRKTGIKLGPIAGVADADIEVLERVG